MAANDLVKAGIGGAFFISKEINYQMEHDPKCPVLVGFTLRASIVSDIIVAGMNLEKYVALNLRFPYWHRVNVTARRILNTALVSILAGYLLTVIRVFSEAGRFLVVLPFAICIISTFIFAVSIWRVISKLNRQIQAQSEQANVTTLTSSERKAAKMATYIAVGLLFTSIIPLLLLTMVIQNSDSKITAEPLLQSLPLLGCLINPIIYGFMNRDIRKACKEMINCKFSNSITIQVQP
ncbi:sphingosine 1-phosphate receptor 5-like [Exaiptasia diaphana]|uniref:G-protein coupled receptors family 1 profile domain-containing protein n=1 Tax=Exaiptasia diaphana TaxID=2652724 RepID=A0A913YLJ0_EXADI|nr:sphingosine 1-phosphate receptor 5-like [Exaiptasia diaphana]